MTTALSRSWKVDVCEKKKRKEKNGIAVGLRLVNMVEKDKSVKTPLHTQQIVVKAVGTDTTVCG